MPPAGPGHLGGAAPVRAPDADETPPGVVRRKPAPDAPPSAAGKGTTDRCTIYTLGHGGE